MTGEGSEQGVPNRKSVPWRRDLVIMARMQEVERRHLAGESNVAIAADLCVDEKTVRTDLKRLTELWRERIGEQADVLRARAVRELDDIKRRALAAAEFDETAERAVLYGKDANGEPTQVERDHKGSVTFRGQKAQALNVARQAVMDEAKLMGLVVDKIAPTDPTGERPYADLSDADLLDRAALLLDSARAGTTGGDRPAVDHQGASQPVPA